MEPEVIKAIPRPLAIKWLVFYLLVGGLLVLFGNTLLFPWVKDYLLVSDKVDAFFRFKVVMFGLGASLLPFVAYSALQAWRIIKSQQFPLPGAQVLRDTPIVRGRKALFRGWGLMFCALGLLACAIYVAYIPYMLMLASILGGP
jgi:hypothetical protein